MNVLMLSDLVNKIKYKYSDRKLSDFEKIGRAHV